MLYRWKGYSIVVHSVINSKEPWKIKNNVRAHGFNNYDLTNDLFQNFPLKSKKIDNDHFVLLKATIFLTLPCLPMPSATHASFIHKSLLLRLPCVALRKEA